jgi:hypothetical protein
LLTLVQSMGARVIGSQALRLAIASMVAIALTASTATAQMAGRAPDPCVYVSVQRGDDPESTEITRLTEEQVRGLLYFLKDDSHLDPRFRVDERAACAAAIPLPVLHAGLGTVAPTAVAGGSLAGSLGVAAVGGIAVVGAVVGVVAATSGGSTTSTVSTVNPPSVGQE